jgi:hypothetical protein
VPPLIPVGNACKPQPIVVYTANGGGDILDRMANATRVVARYAPPLQPAPGCHGPLHTCGQINPAAGNLAVQFSPPASAPADPQTVFTYNSNAPAASELGTGWYGTFGRKVTSVDNFQMSCDITTGDGNVYHYTAYNSTTGYWTPAAGVQ